MRTKRKTYDYHSSDYGNEDYGQEDFEGEEDDFDEEDQMEESEADSDYGDSADEKGKKQQSAKPRTSKGKGDRDQDEDQDDTYEDEDPFSPEIDLILADKQVEVTQSQLPLQCTHSNRLHIIIETQSQARGRSNIQQQSQAKIQNWFLIKFVDQSYLHVKWMEESELEEYSYRAKQKIRRYWNQKEKKRVIAENLQRQAIGFNKQKNHHFSDDDEEEEEDEDAAIKGIPLPDLPIGSDDISEVDVVKPTHLRVEGPDGEDLTQHFDKNYAMVERVLSTTQIFPVIHPRQAKQIRGKWQDDCLKVMNVLINFRKNNVCIGLAFAEQLDTENEDLADYFKVVKQPIDFIMIMNRLYQQPQDFWNDLGLVFKNCRMYYKNVKFGLRKQCDALRLLAYHLYNDWYNEQRTRFTTGVAIIPPQPTPSTPQEPKQVQPLQPQEEVSTIVNLRSLLQGQKSGMDLQKSQLQQQQPIPQASIQQQQQPQPLSQQQVPLQQQRSFANGMQQVSMDNPNMSDFWNAQRNQQIPPQPQQQMMMQQPNIQQMQGQQPFQQQTPNLPKFNQIMNPMNPAQGGFQDPMAMQQQMNQMNPNFINQRQLNQPGFGQSQNQFMPPQQNPLQLDMGQNAQQNQQMDWMQGNIDKNIMKSFLGGQGQGMFPPPPVQNDQTQGLQLPSIGGQLPQNLNNMLMQQQPNQMAMPNPLFSNTNPNQMMDISSFQAIQQQQDKNFNLLNQMMGLPNPGGQQQMPSIDMINQMNLMGQGGQDFGQGPFGMRQGPGQLPSLNSLPGFNQQMGGIQLPSLASIGQSLGGLDPYSNSNMFGMMSAPGGFMNPMQQPQGLFGRGAFGANSSAMSTTVNPYDEMSMMLGNLQNPLNTLPGGFNPFGQMDNMNQAAMLGFGNQLPMHQANPQNSFSMNSGMQMNKMQQKTTIIDPQLILPDNEVIDKQDPPVPPCIMEPGPYDLTWILEHGETKDDILRIPYLTQEEIDIAIRNKHNVDQLYLIKWKGLSYTQSSWEPESKIKELYEEKLQDYNKFNRSLDQFQRDRLDQLIKNHKKMVRVTEKKYQTGKRVDPQAENYLALQEAKINRTLLNQKIQEIMGNAFYQVVQYSEQKQIVPQFKKPTQRLKDYQVTGLNWLIRAWHEHRNVVLADEMGLGKTIMTLSLFDHLNKVYKLRGPYLILAPLTTLEHWKRIADEWTNLNSVLYYDPGSSEGRTEIRQWEWFYTDVTYKGTITQKSELYKFNILITSFEVFMQDLNPILQEIPFIYIVVDEAHRLKNKQAKTLKLLKDHPCKRILLLTGTPVQNNTKELWTLLNYIEPEKFNSLDIFLEQYGNLETYEQIQNLHSILKPHFLRRLKEEVDNSIPPLNETVIEVGLTQLQNTYYKGIYGENRMVLAKFGTNSIKTSQLNNIDVQLRKCCNHLFLLKGVEEELTRDCRNEEDLYKKLLESSGKLMLLDKFIEKFKQENHKMLIFSQFKRMLDVIELYLKMKAVPYEKLTGSVKTQDRISAIQRFNDDKTFGVFLLTTRAGGLGINLTSARVVIIFDSDWNPQNDLQAIARAHRIGQKFEVQVYRLITSKTYEEQMFERASKKLGMEQALFSKGAFNQNDEGDLSTLHLRGFTEFKQDSKEIENLLKYGAYAFMDNDNEEEQLNKDIDEILKTGKKKEFTYSKGIYTLNKSTFQTSKYENLPDVDDPDFWNKVMPYESIISISVLEKKFKKEKREMSKSEKLQKEYIKDLEIVFNDFMDAKFDVKTTSASKKHLESDEEKLRGILQKMIKLSGMKAIYVEKCKEWLREMLRTSKRKKQPFKTQLSGNLEEGAVAATGANMDEEFDDEGPLGEDDIIIYDSEDQLPRSLRKRHTTQPPKNADAKPQVGNKRGRKPKKAASYEESENAYDDEDVYGDEEDKEYSQQQANSNNNDYMQGDDDYNEDSEEEPQARYGLRRQNKRQRTGREEMLMQQQQRIGQNLPKMNDQFAKRNEKNGIVCAYCMHPETPNNLCTWFCNGFCQRFFHEECKDTLFANEGKKLPNSSLNKGVWKCDDCMDNKALCFCCKQKGRILVFPKKGKPKAAGQEDDDLPINMNEAGLNFDDEEDDEMYEDEMMNGEDELDENIEDEEDELDEEEVKDTEQQLKTEAKQDESPQKHGSQQSQNEDQKNDESPKEAEQSKDKEDNKEDKELGDQPMNGGKIVINTNVMKEQQETINQDAPPLPQLQQTTSTKIVLNALKPSAATESAIDSQKADLIPSTPEPNDQKYVVRCTLGGCFKYYHVKCVYKNKNVSCINSMKVQRFRCPLHYCEICQASGDSVLIVQCVTCPTAYHLKCLPQDTKAIRLTKKYIICGKHNMSQEDFPKYEEKANAQLYGQRQVVQKVDKRKKRHKKRGRKPKQLATNDEYGEEEEIQYVQQPIKTSVPVKGNYNYMTHSSIVVQHSESGTGKSMIQQNQSMSYHQQQQSSSSISQKGSIEAPKPLFAVEKQSRTSKQQQQQDY